MPKRDPAAAHLRTAAGRLVARVEHWSQPRWAIRAEYGTRADMVHGLVQRLADLAARVEGRVPQTVPRLDNDLALPDQVRVMVSDLAGAPDDVLRAAAADIEATAARLPPAG